MSNAVLGRFKRKSIDPTGLAQIEFNTTAYVEFAEKVLAMAPAGRELSAALTALQEAKFWTNEAVAATYPVPEPIEAAPIETDPTA